MQSFVLQNMSQASDAAVTSHRPMEAGNQVFLNPSLATWIQPTPRPAQVLCRSIEPAIEHHACSSVHNQARVSSIGLDASWRPMLGPLVAQSIIGVSNPPAQQAPFLPMTTIIARPQWTIGQSSGNALLPPTLAWLQALAATVAIPPPHASASADLRRLPV